VRISFRRYAVVAGLAALGALVPGGTAHAALSLSPTGDAPFPERAFVLTLPEHSRLAPGQVKLTENGRQVRHLQVAPVGAARQVKLGVVLAIDASSSMRGPAFDQAIEAARAFEGERNGRQPFALVTFGSSPRVVLPFTDDEGEIDAALSDPGTPSGATSLYDAALRSVQLIREAKMRGGFVVVLSDGTDHGSSATGKEVISAARAANVKIYSVGLQSASFDPAALERLASGGGGEYTEAGSAGQLQEIYRALGAQLSNAHVLSYRSLADPGRKVHVEASVAGVGTATADYRSPLLRIGADPADGGGTWDSPLALTLTVLLIAGLLGYALSLVLRGPRQTTRARVAEFVDHGAEPEQATLTGRLAEGAERSFAHTHWWESFAREVDVAGIRRSPGQVLVVALGIALSLAFLVASVTGVGLAGMGCLVLAPIVVWALVRARAQRERKRFGEQLGDHLAVVGGSLRVGHSLPAALSAALDDAPDPARREFERVVTDERLGRPIEDALEQVCIRMDSRDVEHVSLLARLQREAGADAAEMIDQVVTTVRERQELRRTVRTLTAQGRLAQLILSLLPPGALLLLTVTNPPYVEPLFHTNIGHVVLGLAAVLVVLGSLVIKRIVAIKV
jgi:tight adherence protein B